MMQLKGQSQSTKLQFKRLLFEKLKSTHAHGN